MWPKRFNKYVDIYNKKEKDRAKELDYNNYNLGKYIGIAINSPKKYPNKPFTYEEEHKDMTGKEMEDQLSKNMKVISKIFELKKKSENK